MNKRIPIAALLAALLLTGCILPYQVIGVHRERILIDSRYDRQVKEAEAFLAPYKAEVDKKMSPVVGTIEHAMAARKPESDLSNLLADILVWGGQTFHEQPVLGVYNMGGIRAQFAQGTVTYGDVLNVAPFENHICFLTLSGTKLTELLEQIASRGGEGVSRSVRMTISKDGCLLSATINGQPIDPAASYRIATLDYLAQGNDGLTAFQAKTNVVSPQGEANDVRHIICNYFRAEQQAGRAVNAQVEGRIVVR